jgi:hypothetical protein
MSVDGRMTDTHPCESFVYATATCAPCDIHHLKTIPSSGSEFAQEEEGLVARMEEIMQFFLNLLQVTGGDLAPEKCVWYSIDHHWSKGVPQMILIETQHRSISMTSRASGQVSGINRKAPTEGHHTLGFLMTGDGTSTEHK